MSREPEYSQLDQDLDAYGDKWEVSNSIIWCKSCDSSQAVDQANEPFRHDRGCENDTNNDQHPWHDLAALMRRLPPLR